MATFDVPSSTKTDELRFDSCPTGTSISYGGTGKSTVASFKLPQICVRVSVLVTDAAPRGTAADESAKTDALLAKLRRTIGEKCLPIYRRTTLYTTADSSHVRASYCESRAISDKEKQSIRRGAPISFIDATKRLNLVSETIQKANETKRNLKSERFDLDVGPPRSIAKTTSFKPIDRTDCTIQPTQKRAHFFGGELLEG